MPCCPYKLVLFDLDGTLVDTLDDLWTSVNFALAKHDYSARSKEEIRSFLGHGIKNLIECSLPQTARAANDEVNSVLADFKDHYAFHCSDNTCMYDGIEDLLVSLQNTGVILAVVSNKEDSLVQKIAHILLPHVFTAVVGQKDSVPKKPSPDMSSHIIESFDIPLERVVYIGDSEVDFTHAQNLRCDSILCTWGFRDAQTLETLASSHLVRSVDDLKKILLPRN